MIDQPIPFSTQMTKRGPERLTDLFAYVESHKTVEVKPKKTHSPPISAPYLTAEKPDFKK